MINMKLNKVNHVESPKMLLSMEQKLLTVGYKFGILYVKPNQVHEDDMVNLFYFIFINFYFY